MVAPVPAQIPNLRPRPPAAPLRRRSLPLLATHYPLSTLFLSALCFHILTNCFSRNPFILITIRIAPGCGGTQASNPPPNSVPPRRYLPRPCRGGKSIVFRHLLPLSRLFALFSALLPFVFNPLQPLSRKHPGVGYPPSSLQPQTFRDRRSDAPGPHESSPSTFVLRKLEPILYPQSYCPCTLLPATLLHASGGSPLNGSERRTTQRFQMRLPLTVRWTTGAAVGETSTESRDVSSRGVYFFLAKDVKEGSAVE